MCREKIFVRNDCCDVNNMLDHLLNYLWPISFYNHVVDTYCPCYFPSNAFLPATRETNTDKITDFDFEIPMFV